MGKRTSRRHAHRKMRTNRLARSLRRNMALASINVMENIVIPAISATGGVLLTQWLGSRVLPALLPGQDPRLIAAGASTVAAYGAYVLGDSLGLSPETQMQVAAGAGVAGLLPWVPPSLLPSGSASASAAAPAAPPNAMSGFYQRSMLGGLMVDVSHAGAPYKGMLGLGSDAGDQDAVDNVLTSAEAVSTVEPMDLALPAVTKKRIRRVRETMGTPRDRGWAGGIYARSLFSGDGLT